MKPSIQYGCKKRGANPTSVANDHSLGLDKTIATPPEHRRGFSLFPGEAFGHYRILRALGRGGMGEVYEAEHVSLGLRYALKLLPPDLAGLPEALDRFRREAHVMAQLRHPHIVAVDDFGETDGRYWLRMELAGHDAEHGRSASLNDLADQGGGRVPEPMLAQALRHVLEGLAHAHGRGAVHRDVKPGNVLMFDAVDGVMFKLGDFGLVRLIGEEWLLNRARESMQRSMSLGDQHTHGIDAEGGATRSLVGTYAYMSPEQKRGEAATDRSDMYAVGLMIFRLLTGVQDVGFQLPSQIQAGVSVFWDSMVVALLEQDPTKRPSANALLRSLPVPQAFGDTQGESARRAPSSGYALPPPGWTG